ncbi:superoxide dismutase, Fe-Mn family [Nematocida sp. AWRm80]|nr:superoxide dismutase, Fe-Mn family [Nematocida sp. AWRm80]
MEPIELYFRKYKQALPKQAVLPQLPFEYTDIEAVMNKELLSLHYEKLHQGYIDRYNAGLQKLKLEKLEDIDTEEEKALLFDLGGYINHSFFWLSLGPKSAHPKEIPTTEEPPALNSEDISTELKDLIQTSFTTLSNLYKEIAASIKRIRGSGWIWLLYYPKQKRLAIDITMNQDFPTEGVPLLNIDLWEHAYYLQYKVDKLKYLKAVFSILNWKYASERVSQANKHSK